MRKIVNSTYISLDGDTASVTCARTRLLGSRP